MKGFDNEARAAALGVVAPGVDGQSWLTVRNNATITNMTAAAAHYNYVDPSTKQRHECWYDILCVSLSLCLSLYVSVCVLSVSLSMSLSVSL